MGGFSKALAVALPDPKLVVDAAEEEEDTDI